MKQARNKLTKGDKIIIAILGLIMILGGCSISISRPSDDNAATPSDTTEETTNNDLEWKGHTFTKDDYIIALYDDEYMVLVTDIENAGSNTIRLTYTFFNESGVRCTPDSILCADLYQDHIRNPLISYCDNHSNEENFVPSGAYADNCYEFVFFSLKRNKNVEIDLFLLHSTHCTIMYNVDTEKYIF